MARIGMCDISNFSLSTKSKRAVSEIRDAIATGELLQGALAATPFYNIFGTPSVTSSPFETLITIRETDWDTFISAMAGARKITRDIIFRIAYEREIYTYGNEQRFWNCVSEATK